jgi:hypothetical protein
MDTPPIISPQPPPLPPSKKPFAFQAAQASLLAPVVAIGMGILVNIGLGAQPSPLVGMITGSLGILLIVLGFVFALVSLSGVRRHGKKGILGRATAGLIINSIILALMIISIPMFKKMAERAKEIQKEKMEEQQTQP